MDNYTIMHTEWSNGWGGQEIRILEECRGMARRGHRVLLAGCPEGKLAPRARQAGLVFHPLPMAGPWDLRAIWRLKRLLERESVDILHTHSSVDSWVGGFAARLSGTTLARTRHLSLHVNTNPLNFVYRMPQVLITTGEGIRRHFIEDYGLAPERVYSIPTGIDPERFKPREPDADLAAELGLEPGRPVVAMIAVLRSWKRHDIFCRMAARLLQKRPDTRFLIVGHGPGWDRVNRYLDEMNLRPAAIMTGHREDIERILPLCTVCVLASDQAEGVPQAVLQELACQRAVVATDAGDVGQVVRHQRTGLLVPPKQVDPLLAAVERLLDDHELRRRLGRAGRELVLERYTLEQMLRQTEEAYAAARAGGRRR